MIQLVIVMVLIDKSRGRIYIYIYIYIYMHIFIYISSWTLLIFIYKKHIFMDQLLINEMQHIYLYIYLK